MRRPVLKLCLVVALVAGWLSLGGGEAGASVLSEADRDIYRDAFAASDRNQWPQAFELAGRARNPVLVDVLWWQRLQQPNNGTDLATYTRFMADHLGWPALALLKRRGEESISSKDTPKAVLAWFATNPPFTGHGKLAYAEALRATGQEPKAVEMARNAWVNEQLSPEDESRLLSLFGASLTADHHRQRANILLWAGATAAAQKMARFLDEGTKAVVAARVALQAKASNAEALVKKVPPSLAQTPGLLYDHVRWRMAKEQLEGAAALLALPSADKERPRLWWEVRSRLAREALGGGNISLAYKLASEHETKGGVSLADAEWLSGWIALRFLRDPRLAQKHFRRMADEVSFPSSVSRSNYWLGRTAEAAGNKAEATRYYTDAAALGTYFYGQLAAARLGVSPTLPSMPEITAADRQQFNGAVMGKVARALGEVGEVDVARSFLIRLTDDSHTPGQLALAVASATSFGRVDISVALARRASNRGTQLVDYGFPLLEADYAASPERALVMGLMRQESNFNREATSSVGAKGLMQLMPETAKMMSKKAGVPYEPLRLTSDASYNILLGSSYLDGLIEKFNGSYILAVAGYNAGPGRSVRWMETNGDPRNSVNDAIDWIEMIPFTETRNYVQRVMEGMMVYRLRLGSATARQSLEQELVR